MAELFHTLLYQPTVNAFVFLYETAAFRDPGIAIVLLTILIRLLLYPLFYKSYKNQTILQRIQPAIKKLQEEHKENKEKQAQALLALYREHRVNPFSGFFLLFLQLPILIALYRVFVDGLSEKAIQSLYPFVPPPFEVTQIALGLIDLTKPNMIVIALAALAQYLQGKMSLSAGSSGNAQAERTAKTMVFMGPLLTLVFLYSLPSAVGLYWLTTSVFSIFQQLHINKTLKPSSYGTDSNPNKKTA